MKNRVKFALLITVAHAAAAFAQNPILPDFHADPSARVFDGKLYVYPSHDLPDMQGWNMVDWHVFSTDDMETWTDHGVIFSLEDISWADKEAWAPDCIGRNGKYYFYFPAGGQIGVAVSDSPTGPFKDALGEPLVRKKEAGIRYMIDPNIFIDDDGQAYLYVGGARELGVVKLKADMITRDGEIQRVEMPKFYEGIWVHKHDGHYYASYPTRLGGRDSRANVMLYSMAESPLGPWECKGQLIDNNSHNVHGSITEFKGQSYLFYHIEGPSHWERRTCVEPLFYNEDGTIKPMQMSPPAEAASAQELRVLCFGDSITHKGTWVKTLDDDESIQAINAGRSGRRVSQALEALPPYLAKHQNLDRIILFLGVNDLPARDPRPGDVKVNECVDTMGKVIDLCRPCVKASGDIILVGPPNVNPKTMDKTNLEKGYNITPSLLKELGEGYAKLADEKGVRFLSLYKVVSKENYKDGLHPNTDGDEEIAKAVMEFLKPRE